MSQVIGLIASSTAGARAAFKLLSQTRITYRDSAISAGAVGKVKGGDRLPYVNDVGGDNFAPLGSLDWQVHVYGAMAPSFREALAAEGIELHAFPWTAAAQSAGFMRDAAYLARPDGHIALAMQTQDAGSFARYLGDLGIKPRSITGR